MSESNRGSSVYEPEGQASESHHQVPFRFGVEDDEQASDDGVSQSSENYKVKSTGRGLSGFIFDFFMPLKSLGSRLLSGSGNESKGKSNTGHRVNHQAASESSLGSASEDHVQSFDQNQNHTLSQFFASKGDQPLNEVETRGIMAILSKGHNNFQQEPETDHEIQILPSSSKKDSNPIKPTQKPFYEPSSAKRATRTQDLTKDWLPSSSPSLSTPPASRTIRAAQIRRPRTFYIGPGYSLMNNSSRVSRARKKQIAELKDNLNSSNGPNISSSESLPVSQAESEKKMRMFDESETRKDDNDLMQTPSSRSAGSAGNLSLPSSNGGNSSNVTNYGLKNVDQAANSIFSNAHQAPSRFSNLNHAVPVRPSPLRNTTSASMMASPTPSRISGLGASINSEKRVKRKRSSSIISSAMKEVNAEILTRTPISSPIKPADVINPYTDIGRARRPASKVAPALPPKLSEAEKLMRKRKLDNCLSNGTRAQEIVIEDESPSKKNRIEEILEETIPEVK
ncbi:hypothetical protein BY996DRAFT_6413809 [Phakopsora pachyrhizi]|nr:hypothetical protein BY996DRAFT_6413809 [Phakopsora pachyrhizi]